MRIIASILMWPLMFEFDTMACLLNFLESSCDMERI